MTSPNTSNPSNTSANESADRPSATETTADPTATSTTQGDGSEIPARTGDDDASVAGGVISGGDAQRQLAEQQDKYLRLAAEYDNHRRRSTKERQEAGARAQAELVRHIIDAIDDLGRFAHVDPASADGATIVQGVEMVEKKLLKSLSGAGLEIVDPVGEPFDPARHEAVATEPAASKGDDHQVARVYQRGYVFGGQLLRPARVVVKQYNG